MVIFRNSGIPFAGITTESDLHLSLDYATIPAAVTVDIP